MDHPVMDVARPKANPLNAEAAGGPVMPNPNAPSGLGPVPNAGQTPPMPPGTPNTKAPKQPKPRRKGLIIGIIVGVILLIGAGAAIFFIVINRNKPEPATTPTQSQNQRVTTEEIDSTITGVEQTLNTLNDSSDVTPTDVSDSSLGL